MICPDCNGKKVYQPLVGPAEDCTMCGGTGSVPDSGIKPVDDGIDPESGVEYPWNKPVIVPVQGRPHTAGRLSCNLVLCQRWLALSQHLVSGVWYVKDQGSTWAGAINYSSHVVVLIDDYEAQDWVCEFQGNAASKYYLPGDANYTQAVARAKSDPCYTFCRLFKVEFACRAMNLMLDEFEHSRAVIDELIARCGQRVHLKTNYDPTTCLFKIEVS